MANIIPFEYQGQPVEFTLEGWINATAISKKFSKRPSEWIRLPATARYMQALSRAVSAKTDEGLSHFGLVRAVKGGSEQGTWIHPKLAVHFARWLDDEFAVWCDLHIDAVMRGQVNALEQYDIACRTLESRKDLASEQGRGLAHWRHEKRPLEARVDYWREQLQMTLALDRAA